MELWIIFAIANAFLWALTHLINKILLQTKNIDIFSLASHRYILNGLLIILFFFIFSEKFIITSNAPWAYLIGMSLVFTFAGLTYFFALNAGDISKIVPIGQSLTIILSFLFAIILLGETTNVFGTLGVLSIFLGAYIVLSNGKIEIPKLSRKLIFVILWGLALAVWGVLSKTVVTLINPFVMIFILYLITSIIFAIIVSIINFKKFYTTGKIIFSNKKLVFYHFFASFVAIVGVFSVFMALSLGNAAKVLPIANTVPLFSVFLGWLVLKEKHFKIRLIGSILIVLGIFLIY